MKLNENETPMNGLRRWINWLDSEIESILDDLPNWKAIIDYIELLENYDVDFLEGVIECIQEGENPKAYNDFVKKYDLKWKIYPP